MPIHMQKNVICYKHDRQSSFKKSLKGGIKVRNYKVKKEKLVMDIIHNFHYTRWVEISCKRIDEIPPKLQAIYYRFGALAEFPASSRLEEKKQLTELKKIRKLLKKYYKKGDISV